MMITAVCHKSVSIAPQRWEGNIVTVNFINCKYFDV